MNVSLLDGPALGSYDDVALESPPERLRAVYGPAGAAILDKPDDVVEPGEVELEYVLAGGPAHVCRRPGGCHTSWPYVLDPPEPPELRNRRLLQVVDGQPPILEEDVGAQLGLGL